jgi:hypothetical protein
MAPAIDDKDSDVPREKEKKKKKHRINLPCERLNPYALFKLF